MLNKIFYSIFIFLLSYQYADAEAVANFQVQSSYLNNGKIKLNNNSVTPIKVDVGFVRFLTPGTNNLQSANIYFKIVAINLGRPPGQGVIDLTQFYNITTNDFGANKTGITKTYSVNINYSNLGITSQNLRIALMWKSNETVIPQGDPYGLSVWNPPYQVEIVQSVFYNVAKNGSFTRNNCSSGLIGSSVIYTVPANTYNSTISQADADQKAQNDISSNGQNNANAKGTCSVPVMYYNVVLSQIFRRNNCGAGSVGGDIIYSVPARVYNSIISQADANQKAINDINANGQNYANAHASCSMIPNNDFDMFSDFTFVGGSLGLSNGTVSGSLTFGTNSLVSGVSTPIAEFRSDDYIPSGTRNFYSGNWLITITPSSEKRIIITWMGGGSPPSGNVTINIMYQV